MKLSVIICVYNTRIDFLEKCISSLTSGTLSRLDHEICMVDDGSSVDYSSILEKYSIKYVKTENRGILRARLLGVDMAEGEYITFLDSDDSVSMNYHFPMVERADATHSDIVINDWAFHTERSRYACLSDSTVSEDIDVRDDDVLLKFFSNEGREHSYFVLWNKIYKRQIMKQSAERVREVTSEFESYSYSEDALLNFYAFMAAKRVVNVHTGYYFYRIHDDQTVKVVSKEKLKGHIVCMTHTLKCMKNAVVDHSLANQLLHHIDEWGRLMSRTHYSYARTGGYDDLYDFIREGYGVDKLFLSTLRDGRAYSKNKIIGSNIEDIDLFLIGVLNSCVTLTFDKRKLDPYAKKTLEYIKDRWGRVEFSHTPNMSVEREKVSLKQKIVHNYLLYTIGIILFPKGSKIRAFLKKVL